MELGMTEEADAEQVFGPLRAQPCIGQVMHVHHGPSPAPLAPAPRPQEDRRPAASPFGRADIRPVEVRHGASSRPSNNVAASAGITGRAEAPPDFGRSFGHRSTGSSSIRSNSGVRSILRSMAGRSPATAGNVGSNQTPSGPRKKSPGTWESWSP